jgi:hypothetical protein
MSTPLNPYQAPATRVDDVSDSANPQAESIRREHINHEASIKAVGTLYYLSMLGLAVVGLTMLFSTGAFAAVRMGDAVPAAVLVVMAAVFLVVGRGLRKLQPWVRIPTVLLSILGLLGFPIGTLINGYIIWLILSKKGRLVLSPEYAAIVEATPQVKYRTSIVVWILLGLVVLLVAVVIVIALVRR